MICQLVRYRGFRVLNSPVHIADSTCQVYFSGLWGFGVARVSYNSPITLFLVPAHRLLSWLSNVLSCGEVAGLNPGRINTQDRKITEEKVLPL